MDIWQAIVLGLVEGITEYLPVSSTGHLILAEHLMGLDRVGPLMKSALDAFTVVIQGGAILAVLGLYAGRVGKMLRGLAGKDAAGFKMFVNLVIAFIPSAVIGLLANKWIDAHLFFAGPVIAAQVLGAIYMMVVDAWAGGRFGLPRGGLKERTIDEVTPGQALFIGLLQCFSLWPGTSRSMMTITGGMMIGLKRGQAAEFSFLLGLPTLTAATAYKLYKNVHESHKAGTPDMFHQLGAVPVLVGIAVATVAAALAVRWLVGFLNRRGLTPFGWYRLALAAVLLALGSELFAHHGE